MTEEDRLDFVAGETHALIGMMLVIVRSHPDPGRLKAEMDCMDLAATARTGASGVSDEFLSGWQSAMERFYGMLKKRQG